MADILPPTGRLPWNRRRRPEAEDVRTVAVLGLGRFGSALAVELERLGVEVLGVDVIEERVQEHDALITHAVRADIARMEVIEQLGVAQADRVVVAVGGHLEASVLACSHLVRAGVVDLWAKAESGDHAQILEQIGVPHVVMTQRAMGLRIAHRLVDRAEDWVDYGGGFQMGRFTAPSEMLHQTIAASRVADRTNVRVIARRAAAGHGSWEYVSPQTILEPGDELIVGGDAQDLAVFGKMCP